MYNEVNFSCVLPKMVEFGLQMGLDLDLSTEMTVKHKCLKITFCAESLKLSPISSDKSVAAGIIRLYSMIYIECMFVNHLRSYSFLFILVSYPLFLPFCVCTKIYFYIYLFILKMMVSGTILLDHNCSTIAAGSKVAVRMDMLLVEGFGLRWACARGAFRQLLYSQTTLCQSVQSQPLWGVEISGQSR
ncbi:unnamed protein product [Camellia sinensis]